MAGEDGKGNPDQRGIALKTLVISLALGTFGYFLFDEASWGLNFAVFLFALAGGAAYLWRKSPLALSRDCAWLALPILLFAAMMAWRDSESLRALNFVMTMLLGALVVSRVRVGGLSRMSLSEMFGGMFAHWSCLPADFWILAIKDPGWKKLGDPLMRRRSASLIRGVLFAMPVLMIFGGLLSSADAVFYGYMQRLTDWDLTTTVSTVTGIIGVTWLTGSLYRRMFVAERSPSEEVKKAFEIPASVQAYQLPSRPAFDITTPEELKTVTFGVTEAAIVLGSLNALFLAFVLVQVRYLFGGDDVVQLTQGLTYSEYARSGFTELVLVVLLALPLLIMIPNSVRNGSGLTRIITILTAMTIALLFVVMVSAFKRMGLYVDAYGLSVLRFNVAAFMVWMGMCLVVLAATILAGRPQRFAFGSVVSACIAVLGMNLVNPDALIANVNLDRYERTGRLDVAYLNELSADAVPAAVRRLSASGRPDAKTNLAHFLGDVSPASEDWREWNWGEQRAQLAMSGIGFHRPAPLSLGGGIENQNPKSEIEN